MLFCTQAFLLFFTVVFVVYWVLPRASWRLYFLLTASIFFYATWSRWLAAIVCLSTFIDYLVARGMDRFSSLRWRRALLLLSLVMNLGLLGYFKYANFFLHSLEEGLRALGAARSLPVLAVILPIGISFYTFEAINYTIDVYRRRVPAERNLAHFMLFITFFPHLVAGPIVRAKDFLPQLLQPKQWNWLRLHLGLQFVLVGLYKKMVIADRMAIYAEPIFKDAGMYGTLATWMAVVAYALQIYCDFSGYSDLALGTAHMLGYKLARNFNMPYLAVNVADFWHRWHISLSTWLRDYLFIPLGGSRGTSWQTARNLMITMTLGGLWHGAQWTFIIWGALHGALLLFHRSFRTFCTTRPGLCRALESYPGTFLRIATTFLCVCVGWIFFRATSIKSAWRVLSHLVKPFPGLPAPLPWDSLVVLAAFIALGYFLATMRLRRPLAWRLPGPVWGAGYSGLLTLALVLAPEAGQVFIYFQF